MRYVDLTGSREAAGRSIRLRDMARRLPQLVRRSLALAWQVDRPATIGLLLCQATAGVMQALGLVAISGTLTALLTSDDVYDRLLEAWPSVALLAGAAGVRALLGITVNWLSSRLGPMMSREAEQQLLLGCAAVELCAYDDPEFNRAREAADRGAQVTGDLIDEGQDLIASAASFVAGALVLAGVNWLLLPLLIAASLPQAMAQISAARVRYLANLRSNGDLRMLSVLRWHIYNRDAADQIRAGTMAPFLSGRYRETVARINREDRTAADKGARMSLVGALCGGLGSAVVWAAVVLLLADGRISVGHAGTAIFALQMVGQSVRGLVAIGARAVRTGLYMDDWSDFLERAGGFRMRRGTRRPEPPGTIEVKSVTHRYAGKDRDALSDVSLTLRRGEVTALVGFNGSGKSTLSKLISGLNLPTAGEVLWDGKPVGEADPQALWRQVALVPQDYAHWPLTVRENVHLGQPTARGDAAVREACEAAGADEVVDQLASGLDTLLAREWLNGEELSGGQWQRIALARAFFREAGLLVLDEPTANLDPRAEYRIFQRLRDLAQDRVVLLVTHRITNVAVADRIVVLDEGRVVQEGTYQELSQQAGMFQQLLSYQVTSEHSAEQTGTRS
ncbi:ABC transporter ATP-binding protein [Streptomyces incarnatus]|uniref:ABC transporter ATP-binding protein n=1 Tax=unclassified Streptomyces TaxID=2593676 RepID=UPI0011A45339|nr:MULTISPECIES: ABC transporter ATP-binding protein [Streptomyces]QHC33166.1 ATP-binding cassette domain-containing protein [Streptomyces sp. HF10]WKE73658.1 ABC transporter ATP-binding protein [Streptomyces sp. WP-1]